MCAQPSLLRASCCRTIIADRVATSALASCFDVITAIFPQYPLAACMARLSFWNLSFASTLPHCLMSRATASASSPLPRSANANALRLSASRSVSFLAVSFSRALTPSVSSASARRPRAAASLSRSISPSTASAWTTTAARASSPLPASAWCSLAVATSRSSGYAAATSACTASKPSFPISPLRVDTRSFLIASASFSTSARLSAGAATAATGGFVGVGGAKYVREYPPGRLPSPSFLPLLVEYCTTPLSTSVGLRALGRAECSGSAKNSARVEPLAITFFVTSSLPRTAFPGLGYTFSLIDFGSARSTVTTKSVKRSRTFADGWRKYATRAISPSGTLMPAG
mmetsp:Transcript_2365/g.5768  ORF Transcript_2365/g.5768 Transcript_2365/m.5768 type:complete len:343 (+) Transcript_2365:1101-2129(+)